MTWGEAWRVFGLLVNDPSSQVAASIAGWDYPATREDLSIRNLYDLQHEIAWVRGGKKGGRPKPLPRPWRDQVKNTLKPSADLTQAEIIAALRAAGHTAALPDTA